MSGSQNIGKILSNFVSIGGIEEVKLKIRL